ncbi:E3 ubiquitin-protein ligase RNF126-like [Panicum virgatum]|uniref:E3 ubiquitin-protein ligase RNF126-like n=1 Tax=Panicum virgatum TaxID=38727 RepID=UPI0019D55AA0|nr:E3 ubiquitin-protein ligase RNF126-like [Panicum virgatum]
MGCQTCVALCTAEDPAPIPPASTAPLLTNQASLSFRAAAPPIPFSRTAISPSNQSPPRPCVCRRRSQPPAPLWEVGAGYPLVDCAVCIAEVAAGEAARMLPRCGHAFHVECIDMWLRSHSTCPLSRCAAVDEAAAAVPPRAPGADLESANFPIATLAELPPAARQPPAVPAQAPQLIPGSITRVATVVDAARVAALRWLLGCSLVTPSPPTPPQQQQQDFSPSRRTWRTATPLRWRPHLHERAPMVSSLMTSASSSSTTSGYPT